MNNAPEDIDAGAFARYRGTVTVRFSAALRIAGLEPGETAGRLHGHDFTAVFLFESATLTYPGVVVDHDMRDEITGRITDRLHHRDLDRLLDRAATCEALADYLATWYVRSARPPGHARLLAVTVTTAAGDHGEIHLPAPRHHPAGGSR
ncbi:6-pyruvoyl trahydropterin synthase family protein [Pseudonocardia sichuanensis]|uniref:6-carboxy-5,6,7,8-tetrahydropterin synthase n=1 Tax=Pseudonocardia kunmingensis TaxID=630975 RepID=A0A543D9L4_9PSEU|nr:6-carboxytetrahydropterin synthase [Pseudonocardia kunmingensis]TQM06027.1 6-pyruvoyltetrahydropterin/6-carboxytetrahydropterin synthase [Pseudonocardia kunmingensis]